MGFKLLHYCLLRNPWPLVCGFGLCCRALRLSGAPLCVHACVHVPAICCEIRVCVYVYIYIYVLCMYVYIYIYR